VDPAEMKYRLGALPIHLPKPEADLSLKFEHFHLKLTSLIRNAEDLDAIFVVLDGECGATLANL